MGVDAHTTPAAELRFEAMGTDVHIVVTGLTGKPLVGQAQRRIAQLEQRWSRFVPSSEVSQLNQASGRTTSVSSETFHLIERAVLAWRLTDGAFDPTMLLQLEALGYDKSFAEISGLSTPTISNKAAGCEHITLDHQHQTVTLPTGVSFDPGGIGKGFAADLVSGELIEAGAWGALVNIGGDLRVRGISPTGLTWRIDIAEPTVLAQRITTVELHDAGLATSTTRKRRWMSTDGERHHLLHPATGLPHTSDITLTSAIAGEAWWAEAVATALLQGQPHVPSRASALRVRDDGTTERLGSFERYER